MSTPTELLLGVVDGMLAPGPLAKVGLDGPVWGYLTGGLGPASDLPLSSCAALLCLIASGLKGILLGGALPELWLAA